MNKISPACNTKSNFQSKLLLFFPFGPKRLAMIKNNNNNLHGCQNYEKEPFEIVLVC